MANSSVSKSWFAVFNNPEDHGYTGSPEEICEKLRDEWVGSSTTRTGAWAYCISKDGLHHVHMVLEDAVAMRFSIIKKSYAQGMHFNPTKGTKKQAEDYIHKRHPFEEKGETVVCIIKAGEIQGRSANRSDLAEIEALLKEGHTPAEIMAQNINYRRYDRMIRDAFFDQRYKDTPPLRTVKVHWIFGDSGSGKTYHFVDLCETVGEENIYLVSDFKHGAFDKYCAEKILFIDELKPDTISYASLLSLLDGYKKQISARYTNAFSLWSEIYITSVFAPEEFYNAIVPHCRRLTDTFEQLRRRIADVTYCYFDDAHQRQFIAVPIDIYRSRAAMQLAAQDTADPFPE